jgi:hypothetical protein
MMAFQRAIGEKVGGMIMIVAMFICGVCIAIAVRWTLALLILASLPFLAIGGISFIYLI